jgi:hypothetical protein
MHLKDSMSMDMQDHAYTSGSAALHEVIPAGACEKGYLYEYIPVSAHSLPPAFTEGAKNTTGSVPGEIVLLLFWSTGPGDVNTVMGLLQKLNARR